MVRMKLFVPTQEKLQVIADWLMDGYLVASDESRNINVIWNSIIPNHFYSGNSLFYELPDFGGVLGFRNMIPKFKAHMVFKIWNPDVWTHKLIREGRDLISKVREIYELNRISSQTADDRIVRISEMVGFEVEANLKDDFMWNEQLFDLKLLGMTGGYNGM